MVGELSGSDSYQLRGGEVSYLLINFVVVLLRTNQSRGGQGSYLSINFVAMKSLIDSINLPQVSLAWLQECMLKKRTVVLSAALFVQVYSEAP